VLGTFLLAWMSKGEVKHGLSKFVGIFVIVISLLGMLCTFYYGFRYRSWGIFDDPDKVMGVNRGMGDMKMMMGKCPMMEKMMGSETQPAGPGGMKPPLEQSDSAPKGHDSHH
jgi:hypothetical protein